MLQEGFYYVKKDSYQSHQQTIRREMIQLLEGAEMTARDLSQSLGIREREVYDHLSHISHTVAARKKKLRVLPFQCLTCGYLFEARSRFTRPSRCPHCKKSHIEIPRYSIS